MLGNRRYCYPLTITDFASRYLLTCEALSTTQERFAFTVFERTFKEFGLPQAIRTDNGVPFASAHALYGSASWRSGGSASGFRSSGSSRGIRSKTAGTSACTDAEERSDQAGRAQRPAAAGALRHLRRPLQPRAAASGARDESAGRRSIRARRASTAAWRT